MLSFDELEKMEISEDGKMVGMCRLHLIDFMKRNKTPLRTPELIDALCKDADRVEIPLYRGECTRREGYACALVSERQKQTIIVLTDYYNVWHDYQAESRTT